MGRNTKPRCGHGDCFTCPYDECIAQSKDLAEKHKPGRPRLPEGVVHQHQLEYAKKHYQEHKEEKSAYYKQYYARKRAEIRAKQKEYYRRKKNGETETREHAVD